MNKKNELEDEIKKLKEEIGDLKATQNVLWGVCIVLTSVVTSMFMHMFIL